MGTNVRKQIYVENSENKKCLLISNVHSCRITILTNDGSSCRQRTPVAPTNKCKCTSVENKTISFLDILASYSNYPFGNPCLIRQRRGHHTKTLCSSCTVESWRSYTFKQFTLKSPVQQKQILRSHQELHVNEDGIFRIYSQNTEVTS
jgi:hypothetical protein